MKPIEGVRIRAQLKGMPLPVFANTNEDGRFSLRASARGSIRPTSTSPVKCRATSSSTLSRRRVAKDADAATEIECLFEKL